MKPRDPQPGWDGGQFLSTPGPLPSSDKAIEALVHSLGGPCADHMSCFTQQNISFTYWIFLPAIPNVRGQPTQEGGGKWGTRTLTAWSAVLAQRL